MGSSTSEVLAILFMDSLEKQILSVVFSARQETRKEKLPIAKEGTSFIQEARRGCVSSTPARKQQPSHEHDSSSKVDEEETKH